MEDRKNKLLPVLIVFIILTLVLGGYIVYDKVLNKEDACETVPYSTTEKTTTEETTLPEWANYILKQDITSITYGYIISKPNDDYECAKKEITKEELKQILEKMTAGTLKKFDLGGAGDVCDEGIFIKYGDKQVDIYQNKWIDAQAVTDPEVITLLDKIVETTEEATHTDPSWTFEYSWDDSFIYTLLGIER